MVNSAATGLITGALYKTRSNVKLMTIKERLLGGNPIIVSERRRKKHIHHKAVEEEEHIHSFCIHPTYNVPFGVIRGN
ncbi:hypothetical protein PIB30_077736 [Stylosanthes scabra]|uniref:Uncharacterized protein n=1 Tax=Stylosanthes scabra TaxID=79078 RepID=A0ABU6RRE4_9FABA|nr:hypothetical protein [Stylosanthes scabra]